MQMSPFYSLFGVFLMLWMGALHWRRKRIRKAMRDLPTRLQRLLGPEPDFAPPPDKLPEGLNSYASLHRRTGRIQRGLWGVALLWLAYILFLFVRKQYL
ncbi:hypothetical protein ACN2XU_00445 [Primorskyibacter sp. 2E107]|uniref:hypothetical protein n=1 Tax=Primorskyibacter sp. 2E107 TaxID=3403458 RepID=UPI003AF8C370